MKTIWMTWKASFQKMKLSRYHWNSPGTRYATHSIGMKLCPNYCSNFPEYLKSVLFFVISPPPVTPDMYLLIIQVRYFAYRWGIFYGLWKLSIRYWQINTKQLVFLRSNKKFVQLGVQHRIPPLQLDVPAFQLQCCRLIEIVLHFVVIVCTLKVWKVLLSITRLFLLRAIVARRLPCLKNWHA